MRKLQSVNSSEDIHPLWSDSINLLLSFRLRQMLVGDALVSSSTSWRVHAIDDGGICFVVHRDKKDIVKRRKVESVIEFLMDNQAPLDLEFVQDGALDFLNPEDIVTRWKFKKINVRYTIERFLLGGRSIDNKTMPIFYWREAHVSNK